MPVSRVLSVIVADDDDDMRALVVETLRGEGYTTREACDGAELLDMLRDALDNPLKRPDLLVTDVKMPRLSGLGVLDALRRAQVDVPVVLMTVMTDESIDSVARRLGAVGVLRKPFEPDDLLTAVNNADSVSRLRRARNLLRD